MRNLSKVFKALSDTNRLRILKMLQIKPMCVCEIREVLNLANSTVSKHLSILRDADFIMDEKDGKWVNYCLNEQEQSKYVEVLLPLIKKWLPEDKRVLADRNKVAQVDRNVICGI
jgi:ArsR family transcriptional regulator